MEIGRSEPTPPPGLRQEGSRGVEKENYYQSTHPPAVEIEVGSLDLPDIDRARSGSEAARIRLTPTKVGQGWAIGLAPVAPAFQNHPSAKSNDETSLSPAFRCGGCGGDERCRRCDRSRIAVDAPDPFTAVPTLAGASVERHPCEGATGEGGVHRAGIHSVFATFRPRRKT